MVTLLRHNPRLPHEFAPLPDLGLDKRAEFLRAANDFRLSSEFVEAVLRELGEK